MTEKYYHILLKSSLSKPIFFDSKDYQRFLDFLATKQKQYCFQLIAFCLLPNHIHLLIEENHRGTLSSMLHGLRYLYTAYYHSSYNATGPVFSSLQEHDTIHLRKELLCRIRYIHQKPQVSKISTSLVYPYSSFRDYINPDSESLVNRSFLYRILHPTSKQIAINLFRGIHHEIDTSDVFDVPANLYERVEKAKEILKEELSYYEADYHSIQKATPLRTRLILKIHEESDLTQQEIADLLSLSRHIVGRVIRNHQL